MNSETFCRTWDRVTLAPETDERIRHSLSSAVARNPTPIKHTGKLPKIALAAVLSILLLVVTAAAVVIHHAELELTEWHSGFLDIHSYDVSVTPADTDGELGFWYPEALPDSYTPLFISSTPDHVRLFFRNETGDTLELFCCTSEDYVLGGVTGGYDKQDITVNSTTGYRFDATRPEELGLTAHAMLCWTAMEQDTAFRLEYKGQGTFVPDLLDIAESVSLQRKALTPTESTFLESYGDWRPSRIPEGYIHRETTAIFHARTLSVRLYQFYDDPASASGFSYYYTPVPDGQDAEQYLKELALESLQACESVTVGGTPGYYADDGTQQFNRQLFWLDEEAGLVFALQSRHLTQDELFSITESMAIE